MGFGSLGLCPGSLRGLPTGTSHVFEVLRSNTNRTQNAIGPPQASGMSRKRDKFLTVVAQAVAAFQKHSKPGWQIVLETRHLTHSLPPFHKLKLVEHDRK